MTPMTDRALRGASLALALLFVTALPGCSAFKRFAYEGFDRDEWQQPERVLETLAIAPGMHVADVGAGGGYFTFRLADAVGESGRVYAVDVDDDMLDYLRERAAEEGYAQVEVVRGDFGDPLLSDGSIDLVFTSNTYHHLSDPVAYFRCNDGVGVSEACTHAASFHLTDAMADRPRHVRYDRATCRR